MIEVSRNDFCDRDGYSEDSLNDLFWSEENGGELRLTE